MNRRQFLAAGLLSSLTFLIGKEAITSSEITEKFVKVNINLNGCKKTLEIPFAKIVNGTWWNGLIPDDIFYENYWLVNIGHGLINRPKK